MDVRTMLPGEMAARCPPHITISLALCRFAVETDRDRDRETERGGETETETETETESESYGMLYVNLRASLFALTVCNTQPWTSVHVLLLSSHHLITQCTHWVFRHYSNKHHHHQFTCPFCFVRCA